VTAYSQWLWAQLQLLILALLAVALAVDALIVQTLAAFAN